MRLYVKNIPRLANEETVKKWLERAGLHVKGVKLNWDDEAHGGARVEIEEARFPPKALRHLNVCTFWGRQPVFQRVRGERDAGSLDDTGHWAAQKAA